MYYLVTMSSSYEYINTQYEFFAMKKSIIFLTLIFAGMILNAHIDNCAHTNTSWKSDKEAIKTIENEDFINTDEVAGAENSWMKSAHFYSCNEDFGFLIVKSKKKNFVHQNVPIKVWETLKAANSKGGYYNFYIKNKYKLQKNGNSPVL